MKVIRLGLAAIVLLLSACGSTPTTQPDTPTPTSAPTSPPTFTATTTPSPTPAPTLTLTATSTPAPTTPPTATALPTTVSIPVPAEVTAWIETNAVSFDTPLPGHGCDDLRPLLDMIDNARVVALGEATHGTSEFFTMKHRILECLVQEKGFNIFAIEANAPESNRVNAYVQTGQGNAESALAGLYFWTWNTYEVLDMIEWMHTHNQNPGDAPRVSFRGFDMQTGLTALWDVLNYVRKVEPDMAEQLEHDLNCLRKGMDDHIVYLNLDAETQARCRQDIESAHNLLLTQAHTYRAATSAEAYGEAVEAARILVQYEQFLRVDRSPDSAELFNLRDRAMAENVIWLLEQGGPNAKIVLWAHNAHVQTGPFSLPDPEETDPQANVNIVQETATTMGSHLRAWFGDELVVIGFSFASGRFRGISGRPGSYTPLGNIAVRPPLPNSHEEYLYPEGLDRYYLDLRAIPTEGALADWFEEPRWFRCIGSVYDRSDLKSTSQRIRLQEAFDIIISLRETTPAKTIEFNY